MLVHDGLLVLAWLDLVLAFVFSGIVISRCKRLPSVTLSWILAFFIFPYGGVALYVLAGYRTFQRERRIKRSPRIPPDCPSRAAEKLPAELRQVMEMGRKLTGFEPVPGNAVSLFFERGASYGAMSEEIAKARRFIHMEYYIFQPDEIGEKFRDLLAAKAREGVTCRLLVDHIGSFKLNAAFLEPLHQAGVQVAFFHPVRLTRPWGFHLRNHRKLMIVDDESGFIGSQNIGNEYTKRRHRRVAWRDADVCIKGPAAAQLSTVFRDDWEQTTGAKIAEAPYCMAPLEQGGALVQTLPTGPGEDEPILEMVVVALIHAARSSILLTTPYFVPTVSVTSALYAAAASGVDVTILVPHHSDVPLVDWAARSWYRDLLYGGVRIYRRQRDFVHAKVLTIDDRVMLLGSANMDQRSFGLNFESTVLIEDRSIAEQYRESFERMVKTSREVGLHEIENQSFPADFRDGFLRILSPIL